MKMFALAAVSFSLLSCTSDQSTSDTKVIGGRIADYQPFMISMSNQDPERKSGFCGGSWIAEGVILTAAHCVDGMDALAKVSVSITRESDVALNNSLKVLAIVPHPQFDPKVMHNDVALLFVESLDHSGLSQPVTPIPLNRNPTLPEDLGKTTVIGWGNASSYGYIFGDELRQADIPVIALEKCRSAGDFYSTISDNEICAGDMENGAIDSCQGDSGGPLIAIDNGTPVLVGVVSWGIGCALKGKPGVYARVSSYTGWIYEQIGAFKSPVTSSEKNIKDAVAQHCYAGLSIKQNPHPDLLEFETKTNFYLDFPLSKNIIDDTTQTGTILSTCSFHRLGLGQVDLEITKSDIATTTTIKIPALNQVWSGDVKAEQNLSTLCKVSEHENFYVDYVANGSSYLFFKNGFFFSDEIASPDLTGYTLKTCSQRGTNITFAQKDDAADGENMFIIALESSEIGLSKKHFKLISSTNEEGEGHELTATFKLNANSETKGTLSFENKTGNDIHTWVLECLGEITLTDSYGVTYQAQKVDNKFNHTFMTPVNIHGIIKDQSTISFTAEFKDAAVEETLKTCRINRIQLKFSL